MCLDYVFRPVDIFNALKSTKTEKIMWSRWACC